MRSQRRQHVAKLAVTSAMMLFGLTSCNKSPATPSASGGASAKAAGTGIASWYGHPFDGRLTASGEVFDMEKLTAAHRTFPFGTVLLVKNQGNGQTVQVRVNDRGPFVANRIIDLSHAAAGKIAMSSIATVSLDVISMPRTRAIQNYAVQVGSFAAEVEARSVAEGMRKQYGTAKLVFRAEDNTWRVLVGSLPSIEQADGLAQQLAAKGGTPFVVILDEED